jgi:hypothetical protein
VDSRVKSSTYDLGATDPTSVLPPVPGCLLPSELGKHHRQNPFSGPAVPFQQARSAPYPMTPPVIPPPQLLTRALGGCPQPSLPVLVLDRPSPHRAPRSWSDSVGVRAPKGGRPSSGLGRREWVGWGPGDATAACLIVTEGVIAIGSRGRLAQSGSRRWRPANFQPDPRPAPPPPWTSLPLLTPASTSTPVSILKMGKLRPWGTRQEWPTKLPAPGAGAVAAPEIGLGFRRLRGPT